MKAAVSLLAGILLFQFGAAGQSEPEKLSFRDGRRNLTSHVPVIRVPESERSDFDIQVPFTLLIDVSGHVRSAEPKLARRSAFIERAFAVVKALEYRPFVRQRSPIEVELEESVLILALPRFLTSGGKL